MKRQRRRGGQTREVNHLRPRSFVLQELRPQELAAAARDRIHRCRLIPTFRQVVPAEAWERHWKIVDPVYYKQRGFDPAAAIREALTANGSAAKHAELVQAALLRNLDIAEKLGCLTPENLEKLRRGNSPTITRGPYAGEPAEVDHIVPMSVVPELRNEIANLELMPRTLNRRKGSKMGARQRDYLRKMNAAR
jgi:5-methylcytosine-specific restriction endonuclease McrA